MIQNAQLGKEIVVTVTNKIGVLAEMSKLVAEHGINIEAVAGYVEKDNTAKIILVTNDNLRAIDALKKSGYRSATERETIIIELENKPGALRHITTKLASEGIDITAIYGTTCTGGCAARIVFSTSNNEKALVAFKK
jgi:hypothetical protein